MIIFIFCKLVQLAQIFPYFECTFIECIFFSSNKSSHFYLKYSRKAIQNNANHMEINSKLLFDSSTCCFRSVYVERNLKREVSDIWRHWNCSHIPTEFSYCIGSFLHKSTLMANSMWYKSTFNWTKIEFNEWEYVFGWTYVQFDKQHHK